MTPKKIGKQVAKTPGTSRTTRRTGDVKPQNGYSKFRTRWRHVLLIDQRIRSGQVPNCRQLADELEVSRRTILRDIDFLRYDLGAPVEYDSAKGGYVYTEPNWDMPSVRISEGELFAIMVAEKALEAYAGMPWVQRLQRVFDRMVCSLPDRIEIAPRELLSRVSFDTNAASIVDPDVLETVSAAMRDNRTLRIRYTRTGHSQSREFTIDPYILRRARGAWYLVGKDHRSGPVTMFNLSRVISVESTNRTFDYENSGFNAKTYFEGTFGVYETSVRHHVVIEFSGWAAQLVRERQWHSSQRLKDLPRGRLRFEVEVSHLNDIWPWVLSWGREAKVVKPKELAETVASEAADIVKQHSPKSTRRTRK